MTELTDKQVERQDFVDNSVLAWLEEITPAPFKRKLRFLKLDEKIALAGTIREAIQSQLIAALDLKEGSTECDKFEMAFYPYFDEAA